MFSFGTFSFVVVRADLLELLGTQVSSRHYLGANGSYFDRRCQRLSMEVLSGLRMDCRRITTSMLLHMLCCNDAKGGGIEIQ